MKLTWCRITQASVFGRKIYCSWLRTNMSDPYQECGCLIEPICAMRVKSFVILDKPFFSIAQNNEAAKQVL